MTERGDDELVGQVLDGRYRIESRLATGGMATVYLATDLRLDRDCAVKVMRPSLAEDSDFVARFRREARSAARLSEQHVVNVFDQGEDRGLVFLAMEYVPGKTLRQVLADEGRLTPRAALDILEPMLRALAAAHKAGIVHRDVKPENVILREDGMVKVADFGLARAVTSQTTTGHSGVLLGTVAYLSPEQVERGIADPRSDVYAAGLILFEMLTGRKAFAGEVPIQVAYQHVHGQTPLPSSYDAQLPARLDDLVAAAGATDPDQRPADAAAFLELVRRARRELSEGDLDTRPDTGSAGHQERTRAIPLHDVQETGRATGPTQASPVAGGGAATAYRPEHPPAAPPRRRRAPFVVLLLLLLATALAATWWFLLGPGATRTVPKTAGLSVQAAEQALAAQDLDADTSQAFSESVPKGTVISSDPVAGSELHRRGSVDLTVSKGKERYAVPRLAGQTLTAARAALEEERLTVGTVTETYSESVAKGTVVSASPDTGTSLKRGSAVDLTVSKGRQPITVPSLQGESLGSARSAVESLGLSLQVVGRENSKTVPEGAVISSSPGAGGTLFRGDQVEVVVSKGPVMVTVPQVQGKQLAEARSALTAAGFTVKVEKVLGGVFGTVRMSDPAGGTKAPQGSTVTITVV